MFTPGDVVRLKSGGPMMTVQYISNGECYCVWFRDMQVIGHLFVDIALYSADEVAEINRLEAEQSIAQLSNF